MQKLYNILIYMKYAVSRYYELQSAKKKRKKKDYVLYDFTGPWGFGISEPGT